MKKFGTPMAAGPGTENEKVGLKGVGTPGPVGPVVAGFAPDDAAGLLEDLDFLLDDEPEPELCCEEPEPDFLVVEPPECDPPPEPLLGGLDVVVVGVVVGVVFGGVVLVVVVVGVVVVPVPVVVVWVVVPVPVPVVVVPVPVVVLPSPVGQASVTDWIGWVMLREEIGAPSGSWK
jgi:hypothetical protein